MSGRNCAGSSGWVFVRRWTGLVTAMWMMQLSGTYTFSMFSTALKQSLGASQVQLNTLSVAKDLGDSFAVLVGLLSRYLPFWSLLAIGASINFVAYGVLWLVVRGAITNPPFWAMFLVTCLAGNGVSWVNLASFTVSMTNFPHNRGPVTGLLKANMGLSAAIFSVLCNDLFSGSQTALLLLLTFLPSASNLVATFFITPLPSASSRAGDLDEEGQCLSLLNVVSAILAIYLVVADFWQIDSTLLQRVFVGIMVAILASPLSLLLVKAIACFRSDDSTTAKSNFLNNKCCSNANDNLTAVDVGSEDQDVADLNGTDSTLNCPLLATHENLEDRCGTQLLLRLENAPCFARLSNDLGQDHSTLKLLRSWDFYIFYYSCLCAAGSGMAFSNNLGQVGLALGFTSVTTFASCFSLGNFAGRIVSGLVSEHFMRKYGTPRIFWMALAKLPMIVSFIWLATGSTLSLYVGSILLGACHGLHITLIIPVVCEFYGMKYFGTNFAVSMTVLLMGSFLFSDLLAGNIYDAQAAKQGESGDLTCYGAMCYNLTFNIIAILLMVATVVDVFLGLASIKLYKSVHKTQLK